MSYKYILHHGYLGGEDIIDKYNDLATAIDGMIDYAFKLTKLLDSNQDIFLQGPDPWRNKYEISYVLVEKGLLEDKLFKYIESKGNYYITVYLDGTWKANDKTIKNFA